MCFCFSFIKNVENLTSIKYMVKLLYIGVQTSLTIPKIGLFIYKVFWNVFLFLFY